VVGFRFQGSLTQGPAVRATDRRHSLRLDVLTMTRSAYVQVRCAIVALWSERLPRYAQRIRPASTKLDSILPTTSDIAWLGDTGGPDAAYSMFFYTWISQLAHHQGWR
jgi:hypothetical protein